MAGNVQHVVPFLRVTDLTASLRFYVEGLGFAMTRQWIPVDDEHYPNDGRIRWCRLELGDAALMLQEFAAGSPTDSPVGLGVTLVFACSDALALHRAFVALGLEPAQRPFVGNGLWVVPMIDPDGYRLEFSSPTDAPEDTELETHPEGPFRR